MEGVDKDGGWSVKRTIASSIYIVLDVLRDEVVRYGIYEGHSSALFHYSSSGHGPSTERPRRQSRELDQSLESRSIPSPPWSPSLEAGWTFQNHRTGSIREINRSPRRSGLIGNDLTGKSEERIARDMVHASKVGDDQQRASEVK